MVKHGLIRLSSGWLLLLLLASGCGSATSQRPAAVQFQAPPELVVVPAGAALPAVPDAGASPDVAARQASVNLNLQLDGIDFVQTNAIVDGSSSLQLVPDGGGLGPFLWAIYRFDGLSADASVSTLSVALSELTVGGEYYFALADYNLNSWQYFSRTADSAGATYNFATDFDPPRHIGPLGSVYFAVLTYELPATIDFVSLQASTSLAAPQNLVAADGTNGQALLVSWDVVPGAELYEVFYKEAAQPDEFYGFLVETTGDTDTPGFSHTADFPVGKPAVYGVEYEYKVRSTADGEEPSPFSAPDTGLRQIPAPYFISASDRLSDYTIYLVWLSNAPDSPTRQFQAFRDDLGSGPLEPQRFGDVFFLTDSPDDYLEHEYYVVELGPDGNSPPSAVDTGCVAELEQQLIKTINNGQYYADLEPAAHDPALPAVCYFDRDLQQVLYGWLEDGTQQFHMVAAAQPDGTLALTNHLGRPWIAYDNDNEGLGTRGIYMARGESAQPLQTADWDTYLIQAADLGSNNVALELIGGKPALVYTERVDFTEYILHYAYALVADPLAPADWAVTTLGSFPGDDLVEQLDLLEFQGLPLVAHQGNDGLWLAQAGSLAPASPANWTSWELPQSEDDNSGGQGVDLVIEDGTLYVASIEGGSESPGRMAVIRLPSWPPSALSWQDVEFFDSNDVAYGGVSLLFQDGRAALAWSDDSNPGPVVAFPLVPDEDHSWNPLLWTAMFPDIDPDYDSCREEITLKEIDGQLAVLFVVHHDVDHDYHLRYMRVKGKGE